MNVNNLQILQYIVRTLCQKRFFPKTLTFQSAEGQVPNKNMR